MGSSEFKTVFGGIISILIKLAVISISIMLTITIIQRGNTSSGVSMIMKDITNDPTKHYFARNSDVYFAVKLVEPTPEKLFDTNYIKFELVQNIYIRDNSSQGFSIAPTPIEYEFWGDKFPHVEKYVYDRVGLATYICPKNTDFFVRANFNSDNYEIVQINIVKCTGTSCKNDTEISNFLSSHNLMLALISSYVDFDDYENPIHYYLRDMDIMSMIPSLSYKTQYGVRQNSVVLSDSLWLGSQGSK